MPTTNVQVMVDARGGSGGAEFKRGTKRNASDSKLSDLERFEKRLRLLSLRNEAGNNGGKNLTSNVLDTTSHATTTNGFSNADTARHASQDEAMHVDDTRDRVYISDLDAELADVESEDEKLIFLPDIEKRFCRIPKQVLLGHDDSEHENQELVLYTEPKSLTVDESHDSVRRAIIEARHRAREKAVETARQQDGKPMHAVSHHLEPTEIMNGFGARYTQEPEYDLDAMDIG